MNDGLPWVLFLVALVFIVVQELRHQNDLFERDPDNTPTEEEIEKYSDPDEGIDVGRVEKI